jgi:hypothetical protein
MRFVCLCHRLCHRRRRLCRLCHRRVRDRRRPRMRGQLGDPAFLHNNPSANGSKSRQRDCNLPPSIVWPSLCTPDLPPRHPTARCPDRRCSRLTATRPRRAGTARPRDTGARAGPRSSMAVSPRGPHRWHLHDLPFGIADMYRISGGTADVRKGELIAYSILRTARP